MKESATKFNELGIKNIICELTGISLEELEKLINPQVVWTSENQQQTNENSSTEEDEHGTSSLTNTETEISGEVKSPENNDETGNNGVTDTPAFVWALLAIPILSIAAIWVGNKYVLADKEKPLESPSQQPTITDSNNRKQTLQAKPNTPKHTLQAKSLKIGILSDPKYYSELADYLRSRFGDQVEIVVDGRRSMPYSEARERLVKQEWDIAFTLSPILSIAAKDNGYTFAAQMFPNGSPYYQSALFVKSDSPIKSLEDLKPTTTIALGDFNSASSFYMPAYDLFGKALRVDMGHRSKTIMEMVKTGKADVGSVVSSNVENKDNFRIIHLSRKIPGSNVYLSSKLSQSDRETLKKVLLEAPGNVRKQANYGAGTEQDYSTFVKISRKAEEVLKCANFQKNPVNFYCPNSNITKNNLPKNNTSTISGRINGWSRKSNNIEKFTLSSNDNKTYHLIISRQILNQIPGVSNPLSLQNQKVTITGVQAKDIGQKILELKINNPNQIIISKTSEISSNNKKTYQVTQVKDGDTIVVTNKNKEEIQVRLACIDSPETAKFESKKNTAVLAEKNQFLWGDKAKERLDSLIKQGGGRVALNIVDTDRYGRKISEVRLPNGTLVQEALVREGLAMVYRKYLYNCSSAAIVEQAETQAKKQKLNIWADSQFTPPWDWRYNQYKKKRK